jgi:stage II sporulation protein P
VQAASGPPLVAVYHTHTSEDYVPSAGASHTYGRKAGIVRVGETLVQALKERGIPAVHDTTCHDDEKFREAYLRSVQTAERLVKANPELKMLLDVHRDAPSSNAAESRALTTAEINGQKVARIYLIVGTDRLGLAHPNWEQNHAFALKLQQKLETLYPGLSRGIKIDTARFNQHLHPHALLVEIGGDQNTLAEAELGARYLADAIAALLPELN